MREAFWYSMFLLIFCASGVDAAEADLEKVIATCASIKGDLERLECYDQIARTRGLHKLKDLPVPKSGTGRWLVDAELNPIDDTKTVTLTLIADAGVSSYKEPVVLVLRCRSNKTEVYINWNDYLGNEANVLARVGDVPASSKFWGLSTDSKATFYPGNSVTFIRGLLQATRLAGR